MLQLYHIVLKNLRDYFKYCKNASIIICTVFCFYPKNCLKLHLHIVLANYINNYSETGVNVNKTQMVNLFLWCTSDLFHTPTLAV